MDSVNIKAETRVHQFTDFVKTVLKGKNVDDNVLFKLIKTLLKDFRRDVRGAQAVYNTLTIKEKMTVFEDSDQSDEEDSDQSDKEDSDQSDEEDSDQSDEEESAT
ncbi:unnamed protein product [Strongylus vulgaris]|uniref:Uncharacterized protein n=1 Tax=Strongylus vulgaris TaxID=40348 RepID=A0A3P7LN78_STRVU|nr:unnamed protein product [Strongylus vulgaris]